MDVSVSITDSPILISMERTFAGLKEAGASGVEVATGVKSRWRWKEMARFAEKYKLPITSIHQPPWSVLNLIFDEENVKQTVDIGVKTFVFHPLPWFSFSDKKMRNYMEKLAYLKEKYKVNILLENMPSVIRPKSGVLLMPFDDDAMDVPGIYKHIEEYDIGFNLDISHAYSVRPQKEKWFDLIFPRLGNVHLSSFSDTLDHLPLYMGMFNTEEFIPALQKRKYKGLLTFEIFYPKLIRMSGYDFSVMKKSIDIVKAASNHAKTHTKTHTKTTSKRPAAFV